jgi:hypothetical protein
MIFVFCMGLVVGTVGGMFSWLAVAAAIEGKRNAKEGLFVGVAREQELGKAVDNRTLTVPQERGERLYSTRAQRIGPVAPPLSERRSETKRPQSI